MKVKVKPEFVGASQPRVTSLRALSTFALRARRGQEYHGVSKDMTGEPCSDML